jgi:tol-pal system protein YbgF
MKIARPLRHRILAVALLGAAINFVPMPAHAASKEIIELQTQVNQLLDMVQRLQSTLDSRFGALQQMVEHAVDNTNRMTAAVDQLQQKIAAQNEAISGKVDTAAGQVQSVNDSIEELKSRLGKLQESVQNVQTQLQNMQAPPTTQPANNPGMNPAPGTGAQQQPAGPTGPGAAGAVPAPSMGNQAPPLQETFQAGLRDFNGARYPVAQGEFQDVVQYYPQDDLAGQAQYYLGEIAYRQQNYPDAVKAYNAVLENYSTSPKAAAAQLHKGLALIAQNKRDSGIQELRSLIRRHPQTPEAAQARTKLNGMGVRVTTGVH